MRNYQIIAGFVSAQETLLNQRQSTGFYDTRKPLVFNTNFLYAKGKTFASLKPIAKTYFTKREKDLVLNFEILADDLLTPNEKKYTAELTKQINQKTLLLDIGKKKTKDINVKIVTEIKSDEKLLDIIEETTIKPHPKSNAAWIANHKKGS